MPTKTLSDGHEINYVIDDFTDPWTSPPPIVLHHGFSRSIPFWYAWVPVLARHYPVIRIDARGFGLSTLPGPPSESLSVPKFANDLVELAHQLEIGPFHFCGEALGGIVGTVVAASHPALVRSLTLVSTPTRVTKEAHQLYAFGRASWQDALRELGVEAWARKANAQRLGKDASLELREWYVKETAKNDVEFLCALIDAVSEAEIESRLRRVSAPVLVIYPESSKLANLEERTRIEELVEDVRVTIVPGTGQQIVSEFPQECASLLLQFIDDVEARSS